MSLPSTLWTKIREHLEGWTGRPITLRALHPAGGGCINVCFRVETVEAGVFFLKWNSSCSPDMFPAEADGLRALRWGAEGSSLRVPAVVGVGGAGRPEDPAWLLMEFAPGGPAPASFGHRFGEALAELHGRAPDPTSPPSADAPRTGSSANGRGSDEKARPLFGWHQDNFIGSLPQANRPTASWPEFWRDLRLEPQVRLARKHGLLGGGSGQVLDHLLDRLDVVMRGADAGGPSLLHGDLWSGNFYAGSEGEPVLIDPAVYVGVGEVDLAMMELFGGFPRGFREGYESVRPLPPEYFAFRRDLYQLYYLLVHVNLFGASYVGPTLAAARRALEGS